MKTSESRACHWSLALILVKIVKHPKGLSLTKIRLRHISHRGFKIYLFNWRIITLQYYDGLPPGCHRALALDSVSHTSNPHWLSVLHTVTCMFQSYSLQSSHSPLLPLCAKVSLRPAEFCFFIKKEERCVSGSRRHPRASKLEQFRGRAKEAASNSL